jgi:titin
MLLVAGFLLLTALPPVALPIQAASKTFTVTTIEDERNDCDASCSLRDAITAANNHVGADTIAFNIPGNGPHTLAPLSDLPPISDAVTIDGYTQGDATATPDDDARENTIPAPGGLNTVLKIVLDGSAVNPSVNFGTAFNFGGGSAKNSVIRGLVIGDFFGTAVLVQDPGVKIEGNFIGTDVSGTAAIGNDDGVLAVADNVTVGGTKPKQRNLISGSASVGVRGDDANFVVQGNLIGTDVAGTGDLGNGVGVILLGAKNALIGGTTDDAANVIAFNDEAGVGVNASAAGNRILRNSFFLNGALPIDLGTDGITPNDPKDPDTGPNRLQNSPNLTSATISPPDQRTTITGTLDSTPKTEFTLQFFATPPDGGFDEGKTFLGQKSVTTNKKGQASFSFITDVPVLIVDNITATATNKQKKDTSELSDAVGVSIG